MKSTVEHFDVLIVGAGLSGIGAAHHLQSAHPSKSYALFEARDAIGGTWDLFRYPGVRSDSDMQTLGYRFRPWTEAKAIADGPSIRSYVRDTARDAGIDARIRFNHRIERAAWSSADSRYTVTARRTDTGETVEVTCGFLFVCSGYYRYDEGFTPAFAGSERFGGQLIHPQFWPEDLDYAGKRVVVIGSGATAITLVPALTDKAAHVTMLQRSPSYVLSLPAEDPIANGLRRVLPERLAYGVTRWKNVAVTSAIYQLSRRRPTFVKRLIRKAQIAQLPEGYAVDTHFKPRYQPWDERLCIVPDGDLFRVIRDGRASIVTDRVAGFTEAGLELESGATLEADIVITATGLNLVAFGGIALEVDGREVVLSEAMAYKGLMLSDVPNFAFVVGYTNASWTLKADLVSEYVCRLLTYMDERGYAAAVPVNDDPSITTRPRGGGGPRDRPRARAAGPNPGWKAPGGGGG
jgi:cation diffusion facilitator CzcD-associated flavoprotein CzcO